MLRLSTLCDFISYCDPAGAAVVYDLSTLVSGLGCEDKEAVIHVLT